MSYFDDMMEAWEENGCEGDPEDLEPDTIVDLLIQKAERENIKEKKMSKHTGPGATHYACDEMIEKNGLEAECCGCKKHKCIEKPKCKTCYGFGLWGMGDASPMGPMDAGDGLPTVPCPECGANKNPIAEVAKTVQEELDKFEQGFAYKKPIESFEEKVFSLMFEKYLEYDDAKEAAREINKLFEKTIKGFKLK